MSSPNNAMLEVRLKAFCDLALTANPSFSLPEVVVCIISHLIAYAGMLINRFQSASLDALGQLSSPAGLDDRHLLVSSD
jgi:hypothetical protein